MNKKNKNKIEINIDRSSNIEFGDITISNNLPMDNQDQEELLKEIQKLVEESGLKVGKELFDSFREELEKPEPRKSTLELIWNGIKSAVPLIGQATGLVSKVGLLIA